MSFLLTILLSTLVPRRTELDCTAVEPESLLPLFELGLGTLHGPYGCLIVGSTIYVNQLLIHPLNAGYSLHRRTQQNTWILISVRDFVSEAVATHSKITSLDPFVDCPSGDTAFWMFTCLVFC